MSGSSRFACPSSELDLDFLLAQLRKTFWLSLGLAVLVHLALVGFNPFEETQIKVPRPMTTKFIKREPRLTKPLELRKLPKPKRQLARRRQVQLAVARMDQVQATASFNTRSIVTAAGSGMGSRISVARTLDLDARTATTLEPMLAAEAITNTRTVENKIDMALEMMDVNSMDTGRYRAVLIQDPNDRQALKGFIKLAQVISARSVATGTVGFNSLNVSTIDVLRDALNEFTGLQADFVGTITYDDERLMEVPVILPYGSPNESEKENLARYLLAGGFVFGGIWTEALEKYGGLVSGKDFWTQRLPDDHPVYSAFFDLKGGVPAAYYGTWSGKQGRESWNALTGYFIKGRLAGISSHQGWGWENHQYGSDSTRTLQLAINIIVFALTQEGSMTQRLMQMVN